MNPNIIDSARNLRSEVFPAGFAPSWLEFNNGKIRLTLPFPAADKAQRLIASHPVLSELEWEIHTRVETLPRAADRKAISAKNVIAVASGKGGVGKSAVTASLALALAEHDVKVGILDADIFGPSMPTLFGMPKKMPEFTEQRKMHPIQRHGIYLNSLGYLTPPDDATVWRGPMASRALEQLCFDTLWPQLDYLLIDLPPGTGDIQLTLAQKLPVTGAIVVTTPQEVALADARKAISMFQKVDVPVFGLIENMSFYACSTCGEKDYIFGQAGGAKLAQQAQLPLLGEWPLNSWVRECFDKGTPSLIMDSQHAINDYFRNSAALLAANAWLLSSENAEEMN